MQKRDFWVVLIGLVLFSMFAANFNNAISGMAFKSVKMGGCKNLGGSTTPTLIGHGSTVEKEGPPADGLQVWLEFNDDLSDGIAEDSSGNGNDGSCDVGIDCPTFVNGVYGGGYQFDGVDDLIDLGTSAFGMDVSNEFTVAFWTKPLVGTRYDNIIGKSSNPYFIQFYKFGNLIRTLVELKDGSGTYLLSNTPLDFGQWYHVALTFKSGERNIYINNNLVDKSDSLTGTLDIESDNTIIGGGTFNGVLDDVVIYNRALTSSEIKDVMDHESGDEGKGRVECNYGQTRDCPLQNGVCYGSYETCTIQRTWPGCDDTTYSRWSEDYANPEGPPGSSWCNDKLDNDCDGWTDMNDTSCHMPPMGYKYVREPSGGSYGSSSGNDWNNAYAGLPDPLERGIIYYIADGTYEPYVFDDHEVEMEYIVIKKAIDTLDGHGTDVGWSSDMGDGQALFITNLERKFTFTTGYWIFDGVKGSGKDADSYGFKMGWDQESCNESKLSIKFAANNLKYITLSHIADKQCGPEYQVNPFGQTIYQTFLTGDSNYENVSYVTISHNHLHNFCVAIAMDNKWSDTIIERNYFQDGWSNSSECHGEGVASRGMKDSVLRYNIFEDVNGTGHTALGKSPPDINWQIYGNLHIGGSKPYGSSGNSNMTNSVYHHNTFAFIDSHAKLTVGKGRNNSAYNNIFYMSDSPTFHFNASVGEFIHDYNSYYDCYGSIPNEPHGDIVSGVDPFVNSSIYDFHLNQATMDGTWLEAPFDVDYDGNERGLDGNWDRGAYEYEG